MDFTQDLVTQFACGFEAGMAFYFVVALISFSLRRGQASISVELDINADEGAALVEIGQDVVDADQINAEFSVSPVVAAEQEHRVEVRATHNWFGLSTNELLKLWSESTDIAVIWDVEQDLLARGFDHLNLIQQRHDLAPR